MVSALLSAVACLVLSVGCQQPADQGDSRPANGPIRVFVLAGQSNMEGQGVVAMDHPQYYNGGKGNLAWSL